MQEHPLCARRGACLGKETMSQGYQRSLPLLDDLNRFYWTSGKDGVLRMLRCQSCGHWQHPPRPVCPKCLGRKLEPDTLSGKGKVFSFTVNAKSWGPGLEVPYVIGIVMLDEQDGLQLTTNLRDVAPEDVKIGMPVEVFFEKDEDVWLPMFRPTMQAASA
ncbi:putative OB-fold protein [Sphingobium wenxiniae]|nr:MULTISPECIES: Zn-ribbon domain-containing OB-fold protein [Sphingobium]MBB6190434.1 putative OB-fold protein [Sphingobium wenxiniae]WRD78174.1 Zn-ribbon domain-containing OB-fold protein [Sphingobium baderi]